MVVESFIEGFSPTSKTKISFSNISSSKVTFRSDYIEIKLNGKEI